MARQESEPRFIRPREASEITGIPVRTITNLCQNGKLEAVKLGKCWLIDRAAFLAHLGIAS